MLHRGDNHPYRAISDPDTKKERAKRFEGTFNENAGQQRERSSGKIVGKSQALEKDYLRLTAVWLLLTK